MRKEMNYYSLLLFLIFTFNLSAQKFTKGSCEFGIISLESLTDEPLDSSLIKMVMQGMKNKMTFSLYFNEDRLAMKKVDFLGSEEHQVLDFKNNQAYDFSGLLSQPSFTVKDIPAEMLEEVQPDTEIILAFGEGKALSKQIYGLDCVEYKMEREGRTVSLLMTKDLDFPDVLKLNPLGKEKGVLVYTTVTEPEEGMELKFGMKAFSPKINDPSVLSIDTLGFFNLNQTVKSFSESMQEIAEEEEANMNQFGTYTSSAVNIDLIENLVAQGALDKDNRNISNAIKGELNHDIPSVLFLARRGKKGLSKMDRATIKNIFKENKILTPTVESLLTLEEAEWNKIPAELKYLSTCVAAIKDHLNTKATKKQIVENLQAMKLANFDNNPVADSYLDGRARLEKLIGEANGFTRLEEGIALNDEELYQRISRFYKTVFTSSNTNIKLSKKKNIVSFKKGKHLYEIDINTLKEIDYEKTDEESVPMKTIYRDTIKIDASFYRTLNRVVKQIGADEQSGLAYSIFHLQPPFAYEINEEAYATIEAACPLLKIEIEALYFQQFPKDDYDPFGNVGISFPYHPDGVEQQINIGSFRTGDIDAGINYLTSSEKKNFTQYLSKNYTSFGLQKERLEQQRSEIERSLIAGSDALLKYLPNVKIVVDKINDITPKSQYRPSFSEGRNDFHHAYAALYRVIGNDFPATDFTYDGEAHKVHFKYNGQAHSVDPGDRNMIRFMMKYMKHNPSGKRLFAVGLFSVVEEHYYYLTPVQKKELGKLVELNF